MKTDALIDLLSRDTRRGPPFGRGAVVALACALIAAWAGMLLTIGVRPDAAAALETVRFMLKFVVTGALAVAATWFAVRAGRPGARLAPAAMALVAAAAILVGAVVVELAVVPADQWAARMIGTNAMVCLMAIPLLAIVPLGAFLMFMRRGAPASPVLAGAVCGLAAGAAAATAYAAHCTDDSPLFVALWYVLAIGLVTALGALIGSRALRW